MVFDSIIKQEYCTILSINMCIKLFALVCEWTRTTAFNTIRHGIVKRQLVVSNNIIFRTKVAIPFFSKLLP